MGKMYVLNATGHAEVAWTQENEASLEVARTEFGRLRSCGYLPFGKRRRTSDPHQLVSFDAGLEEIFWVRPIVGG